MRWSIGEKFIRSLDRLRAMAYPLLNHFSLRFYLADAGLLIVSTDPVPFDSTKNALAVVGTTLNIVAHEDDDLIFLSPHLLRLIQTGRNVRTVFVTCGDAGKDANYWRGREAGARAAYTQMCEVANSWIQTDAGIAEHPIPVFTLMEHQFVFLAFMQLPDGNIDGSGWTSSNYESLQKLWTGAISTIGVLDGSLGYTKAALTSTLTSLMLSFQPDQVNMQDYVGTYGDGDHSDHYSVAYFVQSTLQTYVTSCSFTGYKGYATSSLAANVTGADLSAKRKAFYVYARHDADVYGSTLTCTRSDYALWLKRQYTVSLRSDGSNPSVANTADPALSTTELKKDQ